MHILTLKTERHWCTTAADAAVLTSVLPVDAVNHWFDTIDEAKTFYVSLIDRMRFCAYPHAFVTHCPRCGYLAIVPTKEP